MTLRKYLNLIDCKCDSVWRNIHGIVDACHHCVGRSLNTKWMATNKLTPIKVYRKGHQQKQFKDMITHNEKK